ncbi:MAG: lipopolysaccharide assembly protein LapB [Enterobacteriaceae bacterium]
MLELLFLLLPIAAAYGWYMGRRSIQQEKQDNANRLSREYVTGVNFLLNDQQDKAVDLFLEMLREDSTTFEAHLTLGNLFRSRGEVDRAIRIHQSLIESASLSFEQRLLATQQLGRDYMSAGLLDRAEEMLRQLLEEEEFAPSALQQLLLLYQSTSEWYKAIEVAEKLIRLGKKELSEPVAHFYCELALQAIGSDDLDKATGLLKKAQAADGECVRVSIMQGRLLMAKKEYQRAIAAFETVLVQDKDFISEVLLMLRDCYNFLQRSDEWDQFLRRCVAQEGGAQAILLQADLLEQEQGLEVAQIYVNRQIQRYPTMRLFYRLMEYHLADAEEGRARESLLLLRELVSEQIRSKPRYRCQKCGFTAFSLYWHCPSCRSWATIKPIRGLDGQ